MFLKFEFQNDRSRNFGAVGVEVRHCPLTRLIAYTIFHVQQLCCYRTSCDIAAWVGVGRGKGERVGCQSIPSKIRPPTMKIKEIN